MGDRVSINTFSSLLLLRASERFNEKNLAPRLLATLKELASLAEQSEQQPEIRGQRPAVTILIRAIIIAAALLLFYNLRSFIIEAFDTNNKGQLIQVIESAANLVLISGAAILSFLSFDKNFRRRKVRARIATLRSIVNTIALLQLEKDPARLNRAASENTPHSPRLDFNYLELDCYFEYSIEALEISSAILSSYAKSLDDAVLLEEISDLQALAANKQEMIASRRERLQTIAA